MLGQVTTAGRREEACVVTQETDRRGGPQSGETKKADAYAFRRLRKFWIDIIRGFVNLEVHLSGLIPLQSCGLCRRRSAPRWIGQQEPRNLTRVVQAPDWPSRLSVQLRARYHQTERHPVVLISAHLPSRLDPYGSSSRVTAPRTRAGTRAAGGGRSP